MRISGRQIASIIIVFELLVTGFSPSLFHSKEKPKKTKSVRGTVTDVSQNGISGAKVFVRNTKKNITTVLVTDEKGVFSVFGLDPQFDYEVHAEKGALSSATKTISTYLDRQDTALSLVLAVKGAASSLRESMRHAVEFTSSDGTKLSGEWYQPAAGSGGVLPTVLLLHDFGEDRSIWESFITNSLLKNGYAALALDLRGHGASEGKLPAFNQDARENLIGSKLLLQDLAAVFQWLKGRELVDPDRIAVAGVGLGASLVFAASGKFEAIRSSMAISPDFKESQVLSAGIDGFQPHSILFVTAPAGTPGEASARELEKMTAPPVRVQILDGSSAISSKTLRENPEVAGLLVNWLKNTM